MKNKIIIVIDHLGSGGTQRQVVEYLKFADRNKFTIKIVNLDKGNEILTEEIEELGYEIIGIEHCGFFNLSTLCRLIQIFKQEKPDIVHTYLFTADCYGRLAAKLAGVRVIVSSVRNIDLWQKWHHRLAEKILAYWTDKIIVNAGAIQAYLIDERKIHPDKVTTVHNGIDLKRFLNLRSRQETRREFNIPREALLVGMVGRFSEQKDYDTFFEATEEITDLVYFVAVGDGPLLNGLRSTVHSPQLKERIIFTGLRRDTPDLINAMDICILSSHYEGCPNVILEYMACSKPVIASDVGGCAELVINGKTGFIVPHRKPKELSDKIISLVKDAELRKKMGQEGRRRVEEFFDVKVMAKNTEKIYSELIRPKTAFIFSQFPCYDETFILREMNQLKENGLHFVIYSIKPCKDKVKHSETEELGKNTYYLPLFSLRLIFINLFYLIRHPLRYITIFLSVLFNNLLSPNFFFKTMALWPQAIGFAWRAGKDKISQVHGQWATFPATIAFIISRLNNIPFSFTGHAHDIFVDTAGLKQKINNASFVVTCTAYNKQYLLSLLNGHKAEEKIIVNYHGLDIDRFRVQGQECKTKVKNSKFKILAVGSLLECKGFDILIDTCRILKDKGIDFECNIAGGGPLEKSLKSQASSLKLEERIKFTGYITQDRLIPLYRQADVFALPVRLDIHWGIPNVLLEAMAAKVPVVCTNLPSITELIQESKTGFVIPEKNPEALAETMIKLYKDEKLRKEVGNAGYAIIENKFNIRRNTQNLITLFNGKV